MARLAIISSHPVQYYAPLFRELATEVDIEVFFAHDATPAQQAEAGFETPFRWDVDLTSGYPHRFMKNVSKYPHGSRFFGCDTPEIAEHLRSGKFGALLTLGWHLKTLLQGILAAKRLGLPVMVRGDSQLGTRRTPIKLAVKALLYPRLLRAFDAALYVGLRNRDYYDHYRYPRSRQFHSPHAIDTEWFAARAGPEVRRASRQKFGIQEDERILLFAGKLLPFKRPLDLVDAAAKMLTQGLRCSVMIAGSGPLQNELIQRASKLNIPLRVLGFQNQTQMPAVYAASDLLVLPSTSRETWGLVCNEAISCGIPIAVSEEVGCAPDLAADERVGRSFPLGDIAAMAEACAALLTSPRDKDAIEMISNRHSLRAAADGVMTAMEAVSREKRH